MLWVKRVVRFCWEPWEGALNRGEILETLLWQRKTGLGSGTLQRSSLCCLQRAPALRASAQLLPAGTQNQIVQGRCPHHHRCSIMWINKWAFFTHLETSPYCNCVLSLLLSCPSRQGCTARLFTLGVRSVFKQHCQFSVEEFPLEKARGPTAQNPGSSTV